MENTVVYTTGHQGAYDYCQVEPTNLVFVRSDKVTQPLYKVSIPENQNVQYQIDRLKSAWFTKTEEELQVEIHYGFVKEVI
jgi:hypothetical protein